MPAYLYTTRGPSPQSTHYDARDDDHAIERAAEILAAAGADPADVVDVYQSTGHPPPRRIDCIGQAAAPDATTPSPEDAASWRITGLSEDDELGYQRFPCREDARILAAFAEEAEPFQSYGVAPSGWPANWTLRDWLDCGCGITGEDAEELIERLRDELTDE